MSGPRARAISLRDRSQFWGVIEGRPGRFTAYTLRGKVNVYAGVWPTAELAALARDRLVMHLDLRKPLNLGARARKLGPASAQELRREARLQGRGATDEAPQYLGVCWNARNRRWTAYVSDKRRTVIVGHFREGRVAAEVRDRVVLHLHRRDPGRRPALLNFPRTGLVPLSPKAARLLALRLRKETKSSRYIGVYRAADKPGRPWAVSVGRRRPIARYRTQRAAAIAHDRAALYYEGKSAALNFPEHATKLVPADVKTLRSEAFADFKATTRSRFRGVIVGSAGARPQAILHHQGRRYYLGAFDTEEEAALAYDAEARRLKGKRLRLNFDPVIGEEICGKSVELA